MILNTTSLPGLATVDFLTINVITFPLIEVNCGKCSSKPVPASSKALIPSKSGRV